MVRVVVRRMSNRFRRSAKTIDFKQWVAIPSLRQEFSSDNTFLGGSLAFNTPATILRMRGYVSAYFDETMQAGDLMKVGFGLGIVSSDAFAAGTGSVPDPSSEPEYPWLWWGTIQLEAFIAAGQQVWGTSAMRLEVDSKAMRKIKPGESLTWVAQGSGGAGSPVTVIDLGQTRVLIGT